MNLVQNNSGTPKESHLLTNATIGTFSDLDVVWNARCRASGPPIGTNGAIRHVVLETDGTTEEDSGVGTEFVCPFAGGFVDRQFFMESSPGGGEWTLAEINALECGYQRDNAAATKLVLVTQVFCTVIVTIAAEVSSSSVVWLLTSVLLAGSFFLWIRRRRTSKELRR